MGKSIKQLREDLAVLETNTAVLATELEEIYSKYLQDLGETVKKQIILASYQLCTQKYPDLFLKLSFNERVNLQQIIKNFKVIFNDYLGDYLFDIDYVRKEIIQKFKEILLPEDLDEEAEDEELNLDEEQDDDDDDDDDDYDDDDNDGEDNDDLETNNNPQKLTPDSLVSLHLQIEHSIHQSLRKTSNKANQYLQKNRILPTQIPSKILEMALQAEENGSLVSGAPNLLNLLIERERNKQDNDERDITPITAICLRLSEIEFSEPTLSNYRNQIRSLLAKIEQLREQYLKKQKEYAIAEAEAAWRACWFDN